MTDMPVLDTNRLVIRPFCMADADAVYRLLDVELGDANYGSEKMGSKEERTEWLRWSVLNYRQLALLYQPPYGDRAVVRKSDGELIGACGFVPCLMPFEQLRGFAPELLDADRFATPEFGLFYAIAPAQRHLGYATEAAQALVDFAFQFLRLKRVVAATHYENAASQGVMRKLGMRIERNPRPGPPWLQVVGCLDNPGSG